jgi:hypothetical protein
MSRGRLLRDKPRSIQILSRVADAERFVVAEFGSVAACPRLDALDPSLEDIDFELGEGADADPPRRSLR